MNDRETARYDMFGRVKAFGETNQADFASGSDALKHFTNVGNVITALDQAKAAQESGGSTAKSVLLDALRMDVRNITRTATAIDQDEPGFAEKFPAPATDTDRKLLFEAPRVIVNCWN